ncbi:WD40 repeat domain-containing protein [Actinomadura algeriensis]|uniref:WD40 repeat protein n=1 Tax=Actinomadura algeriensis TaxID=1679523 RepID=A0ABR9JJE3_9ACTN|nr:hypothetical protein [Actinomadura algeriensis]MBE1530553.1 WD40 repeat protein [Actinomadura algeriensis]
MTSRAEPREERRGEPRPEPRAARRASRRAAASAGRSPRGRWAELRLFAAARRRDPDVRDALARVAGTPGHRLRERALDAVATWWAETRDPDMRGFVLELGAVAAEPPARAPVLALLGRLGTDLDVGEAPAVPGLLTDPDPDVRGHATAFCLKASGEMLRALWALDTGPGSPLRNALLGAGEPPASGPLDGLWGEWLDRPDERVWDALSRWERPATGEMREGLSVVALGSDPEFLREPRYRAALIGALAFGGHPLRAIAERRLLGLRDQALVDELCAAALADAALVPICAKHRLAPKDPVRRVVFFLLTGQPEQHRAMDPDGSLLGLAYASASRAERERIQRAMLTAGDLDLVRVIVGDDRRARIPEMPPDEIRYLADQLAARREWDGLWSIVQDVPIAVGAELTGLFDDWTPRGDDERRVFELYRAADPAALHAAVELLRPYRSRVSHRTRLRFRGRVNDVSFAPDGPFLAVAGTNRVAGVFDLRSAELVERYDGFGSSVGRVLHTGDGVLIAAERTNRVDRDCRVVRCADGDARTLHTAPGSVTSLARTGGGGFVAGTRAGNLLLGTPDGVRPLPDEAFGVHREDWPRAVAAHAPSGRIAVFRSHLVVADPFADEPRMVLRSPATVCAAFIDADTLVAAWHGGLVRRLRGTDDPLFEPVETGRVLLDGVRGIGALPGTGEVVAVDAGGGLHVLHADTSEHTTVHRPPEWERPTSATVAPTGHFLAVGDIDGHTDLFDLRVREVPLIVARPVVDLVPRHLGIVATVLTDESLDPAAAPALRLLEACLEHRFRFDVEIGDAVRLSAGEFDISL